MRITPVFLAALLVAGCGASAANSPAPATSRSTTAAPISVPPPSSSSPCDAIVNWRDGGGTKPLTAMMKDLGNIASDASHSDMTLAGLDAARLISDSRDAQANPMPGNEGLWKRMTVTFIAVGQSIRAGRYSDAVVLIKAATADADSISEAITPCAA